MKHSRLAALLTAIACLASPISEALAQQATVDKRRADQAEKSADQIFEDAVAAFEAENYQRALDLLDLASFKEPQPRFVYQRILVLEAVGHHERALAVLDKRRKELAGKPGVGDLTALDQRLREADSSTNVDNLTTGAHTDRPKESDYIGWTLIGSGALAAGGGVTFLLLAESELTEVRCSGIYPEGERQDCDGVDAPAQLSRAEFDQRLERVDSYRILGGSLLAVGVVAAGYGSYRLFSAESQPASGSEARTVTFDAAPRLDGGLEVQVVWQF